MKNMDQHVEAEMSSKIILIEDHTSYRNGLERILAALSAYECVGSFSTLEDALDAIDQGLLADVVLLDLGLPGMGGISGILPLRKRLPSVRVVVLTAFSNREKVFAALEAGAHGYLIKSTNARRLIQTLDEVAAGGIPLDPKIAGMVLGAFQKLNPITDEQGLAAREVEILQLVAAGLTRKGIALELEISSHTVTDYIRRIYDKLHVRSLPAAVIAATRRGWLDFSE